MKRLLEIPEYVEDVTRIASLDLPWEKLRGKIIAITGGTGLIGSFLVDVLAFLNRKDSSTLLKLKQSKQFKQLKQPLDCTIVILGRSEERAKTRFAEYWNSDFLKFIPWDAAENCLSCLDCLSCCDYFLHLASNTHPVAYATDPIGTIATNVIALNSLLEFLSSTPTTQTTQATQTTQTTPPPPRFLFASSNEIYGENRGDVELFDEQYCGYIDCNTLRAGYPESKRCGEALCQAYRKQKGLDVVVARLTRTFGPTILPTDTKAISQFFNNALRGEDIVLKSEGRQYYSYQYVADSVAGLLTVLLKGESGEAFNIADESGDITLRDLATLIAAEAGRKVVLDLPNAVEAAGFSKATKARLDGSKLRGLGWQPAYDIRKAVGRNLEILRRLS